MTLDISVLIPHNSARLATEATGTTRKELRQALAAVGRYLATHQFPQECALMRLDGQYGTGAVLADLAGSRVCDARQRLHRTGSSSVQARLHLPPDRASASS